MLDQLAQWLAAHPVLKAVLIVGVVGCFWEFVARMRAKDMKLLGDRRTSDQRRADQRVAAIAERVSKLRGAGGAPE